MPRNIGPSRGSLKWMLEASGIAEGNRLSREPLVERLAPGDGGLQRRQQVEQALSAECPQRQQVADGAPAEIFQPLAEPLANKAIVCPVFQGKLLQSHSLGRRRNRGLACRPPMAADVDPGDDHAAENSQLGVRQLLGHLRPDRTTVAPESPDLDPMRGDGNLEYLAER